VERGRQKPLKTTMTEIPASAAVYDGHRVDIRTRDADILSVLPPCRSSFSRAFPERCAENGGLKTGFHRRADIYSMYEKGITHDKSYRKSAKRRACSGLSVDSRLLPPAWDERDLLTRWVAYGSWTSSMYAGRLIDRSRNLFKLTAPCDGAR